MATLDVTLTYGSTVYALQVEEFVVNIRRSPYNAPMYGVDPVQEDFGLRDPSIRIRGIIPTVSPGTDGTGVTIVDKDTLEDAITDDFDDRMISPLYPSFKEWQEGSKG